MIYAIHGNNIKKIRERVKEIVSSLLHKKPNSNYIRISSDQFTENTFDELVEAQGLFSEKMIIEMNSIISFYDDVEGLFIKMKESPHVFIVVEEDIEDEHIKYLKENVYKIEEHNNTQEKKVENLFSLTDALGLKDKKKLWVEYVKAVARNIPEEEIHGMLFWQIKSMIVSSKTSEKESKLNPFVYKKAKKYSSNFKEDELNKLSSSLVSIYHDSRRGIVDLNLELERWILNI